jgi:hypothetical protein
MIVVICLIAILTGLMVPAVNGLIGISGPRGGLNALSSAVEQAKVAAMENNTSVYLGFPAGSTNAERAFSHMILFRSAKPGESQPYTTLSRWISLPRGVFIESDDLLALNDVPNNTIPPLEGEQISAFQTVGFDCFGRLLGTTTPSTIRIGEKADPAGDFIGPPASIYELVIEPLTGRSRVAGSFVK